MTHLLDLVALGTVADLVPMDQNNRLLVHHGLERIRHGRGCLGIQALLTVSGKQASDLRASDLGFALGPRLNAAALSLGPRAKPKSDALRSLACLPLTVSNA